MRLAREPVIPRGAVMIGELLGQAASPRVELGADNNSESEIASGVGTHIVCSWNTE